MISTYWRKTQEKESHIRSIRNDFPQLTHTIPLGRGCVLSPGLALLLVVLVKSSGFFDWEVWVCVVLESMQEVNKQPVDVLKPWDSLKSLVRAWLLTKASQSRAQSFETCNPEKNGPLRVWKGLRSFGSFGNTDFGSETISYKRNYLLLWDWVMTAGNTSYHHV